MPGIVGEDRDVQIVLWTIPEDIIQLKLKRNPIRSLKYDPDELKLNAW